MTAERQERNGFSRQIALIALVAAIGAGIAPAVRATTTERVVAARFSGLAIDGFDPVAYFVQNQAVLGLPDYEASVGSVHKMLRGIEGRAEGDPRKIADVIVQLANSDDVPVRLILGVDAEKRVQQAEAARASEAEKWRHLTVSTVFQDAESIPDLLNH